MIACVSNPSRPRLLAKHFVVCQGCKRNGPVVRRPQGDPGRNDALAAAKNAGWLVHYEPRVSPVRKRGTGSWCEQYFCRKCQKAGEAGKHPSYTRSHKKKEPAAAGPA
jgi:hypothetical protein